MAEVPLFEAEGSNNDKVEEQEGNNLVLPPDGYGWKKYGQKFIKNIGKNRSYFKCQNRNCKAKKKAEWSVSYPTAIQVVYEGVHSHPSVLESSSSQQAGSSSMTNQYNLYTQVFGSSQNNPS